MADTAGIQLPRNGMTIIRDALSWARREDVILSDESIRNLERYVTAHGNHENVYLPDELSGAAATVLSAARLHRQESIDVYERLASYISGNATRAGARRYGSAEEYIEVGRFRSGSSIRWWRWYMEDDVITADDIREIVEGIGQQCAWLQELPINQQRSAMAAYEFVERDVIPLLNTLVVNSDKMTRHGVDEIISLLRRDRAILEHVSRMCSSENALDQAITSAECVLRGMMILNDSLGRMYVEWFGSRTRQLARAIMPDADLDDERRQVMVEGCLLGIGLMRTHGRAVVDVLGANDLRIALAEATDDAALVMNVVHYLSRMTVFIGDPVAEHARLTMLVRSLRSAFRLIGIYDGRGMYSIQDLDHILMRTRTMLNELRLNLTKGRTPPDRPTGTPPGGGTRRFRSRITTAAFDGGGGYSKGPTPAARLRMLQRHVQSWRGL